MTRVTTDDLRRMTADEAPILLQTFHADVAIPGTVWVSPEAESADAPHATLEAFRHRLEALTGGDFDRPIRNDRLEHRYGEPAISRRPDGISGLQTGLFLPRRFGSLDRSRFTVRCTGRSQRDTGRRKQVGESQISAVAKTFNIRPANVRPATFHRVSGGRLMLFFCSSAAQAWARALGASVGVRQVAGSVMRVRSEVRICPASYPPNVSAIAASPGTRFAGPIAASVGLPRKCRTAVRWTSSGVTAMILRTVSSVDSTRPNTWICRASCSQRLPVLSSDISTLALTCALARASSARRPKSAPCAVRPA